MKRPHPQRPTRRQVQQALAAQAPPEWKPREREKKRRTWREDEVPQDMGERDDENTGR